MAAAPAEGAVADGTLAAKLERWHSRFHRSWQNLIDKSVPAVGARWVGFGLALACYVLRAYLVDGWFIVTYGLGIYLLNMLIRFLTPQVCGGRGGGGRGARARPPPQGALCVRGVRSNRARR